MNIPGMYVTYDAYDFVTSTVLKSHISNSSVNASCIKYGIIMHKAYHLQDIWDAYDCIFITRVIPQ